MTLIEIRVHLIRVKPGHISIKKEDVDPKCRCHWQGGGVSWACGKWLYWFGAIMDYQRRYDWMGLRAHWHEVCCCVV